MVLPSEASLVQRSRANSSGHFERASGAERARAAISSAPVEPSGLEIGNVGRCSVLEQRPSNPSALAKRSEFERPFRAPQRSRAASSGHFERPSGAEQRRGVLEAGGAELSSDLRVEHTRLPVDIPSCFLFGCVCVCVCACLFLHLFCVQSWNKLKPRSRLS